MRWHGMPRLHLPQMCFHPLTANQSPTRRCALSHLTAWTNHTGRQAQTASLQPPSSTILIGTVSVAVTCLAVCSWLAECWLRFMSQAPRVPGHARDRRNPKEGKTERIARSRWASARLSLRHASILSIISASFGPVGADFPANCLLLLLLLGVCIGSAPAFVQKHCLLGALRARALFPRRGGALQSRNRYQASSPRFKNTLRCAAL